MKNAKTYERKIRKLLSGMKKTTKFELPDDSECIAVILEGILLADGSDPKHVNRSIATFTSVFVDFNELRVAPEKEIADCIDKNIPDKHAKAATISAVLNAIFTAANALDIGHIRQKSNRDIRRCLRELGFPNFAEAYVARRVFDIHAIPVDQTLFEVLDMNELIHPGCDIDDTQSFLERVIPQKNNIAAHKFFREYILKNAAALDKKRKEDAKRLAQEEAEREAKQEAKRLAEQQKQRKAQERQEAREAKEKAKKKAQAAKAAKKKAATKKATKKKKAAKKATKKVVKKTKAKKK